MTPAEASSLRVAVVGDSLSVGFSPAFAQGSLDRSSYLYTALGDDAVLAGGTAVPGATAPEQRERVQPVDADVLILALGTNDLAVGMPWQDTATALEGIARTVGAPRIVLLSIPPLEPELHPTTPVYNQRLRALAAEHGWEFLDAAAAVRDGYGWARGMTNDGVHYTAAGARVVGEVVGAALRDGAS